MKRGMERRENFIKNGIKGLKFACFWIETLNMSVVAMYAG